MHDIHSTTHHHFTRLIVLVVGAAVAAIVSVSMLSSHPAPSTAKLTCVPIAPAVALERADLVLTGEVFLVVPAGGEYAHVLITPSRVYKGKTPPAGVRILALADTGTAAGQLPNDLHFASGQSPYLLFLRQGADGIYRTSRCDGSRLLGIGLTDAEAAALERKQ